MSPWHQLTTRRCPEVPSPTHSSCKGTLGGGGSLEVRSQNKWANAKAQGVYGYNEAALSSFENLPMKGGLFSNTSTATNTKKRLPKSGVSASCSACDTVNVPPVWFPGSSRFECGAAASPLLGGRGGGKNSAFRFPSEKRASARREWAGLPALSSFARLSGDEAFQQLNPRIQLKSVNRFRLIAASL